MTVERATSFNHLWTLITVVSALIIARFVLDYSNVLIVRKICIYTMACVLFHVQIMKIKKIILHTILTRTS